MPDHAKRCVGRVYRTGAKPVPIGSCVFVSKSEVWTALHVVAGIPITELEVRWVDSGEISMVTRVEAALDLIPDKKNIVPADDFASLHLSRELPADLAEVTTDPIRIGAEIHFIGYPNDDAKAACELKATTLQAQRKGVHVLEDPPTRGFSGGPVLTGVGDQSPALIGLVVTRQEGGLPKAWAVPAHAILARLGRPPPVEVLKRKPRFDGGSAAQPDPDTGVVELLRQKIKERGAQNKKVAVTGSLLAGVILAAIAVLVTAPPNVTHEKPQTGSADNVSSRPSTSTTKQRSVPRNDQDATTRPTLGVRAGGLGPSCVVDSRCPSFLASLRAGKCTRIRCVRSGRRVLVEAQCSDEQWYSLYPVSVEEVDIQLLLNDISVRCNR